jgi:stringent starvation protein B
MSDPDPPDQPEQDDNNLVRVDFKRGSRFVAASTEDAEKLQRFTELIQKGMVMATLDARKDGVQVPSRFATDPQLNLNFSHRFGVSDFAYDARGVRSTLTFGGQPYFCDIPWTAVWGLRSHVDNPDHVVLWHASLPAELKALLPEGTQEQLERAQKDREERRRQEDAAPEPEPDGDPPKGGKGGLRLVKG